MLAVFAIQALVDQMLNLGSWGASFISKCIPPEMIPKLNEGICCDPFYGEKDLTLPHYNAKTGEKLFDMPGEEPRRISRKKLRNFLSQGIDVKVRLGTNDRWQLAYSGLAVWQAA
jgi:hypothetical protein